MTRYKSSNSHMMPMLEAISRMGTGTGFVLLMETADNRVHNTECKDYSIWPRFDQPCQGGDMRKYHDTHGDVCTQPHNERPCDLTQPFPAGKPSAIAFHNLNGTKEVDAMFEAVVSDTSPWKKGFGGRKNVIPWKNDAGFYKGFILKNLDVDPTVLVNGVNFLNRRQAYADKFLLLQEHGLTANEALAFLMLNGSTGSVNSTDDYSFCAVFSARRFFDGNPNDHSGGLYSQGVDYNRTFVQDVFSGKVADGGIVWYSTMTKKLKDMGVSNPVKIEDMAKAAKEVFAEAYDKEVNVDTSYHYRAPSGQIKDYPAIALKINPSLAKVEKEDKKVA